MLCPARHSVRRGLKRKDERPPEDHWSVRDEEIEQKLLDDYYEFKGYNKDGIFTKETVGKLGLGYLSKDLLERGILTDNGNPSVKASSTETEKK
ncbi:aldehyde ferredoxin oxidoreductase C-terminal domain-containing protein [Desulfocastanea catecholica]